MNDDQPHPEIPSIPAASVSNPSVIHSGMCAKCGYSLRGLAMDGTCPECGTNYRASDVIPEFPLPSAFSLCLRFGWPLALAAVLAGPGFMSNRSGEPLICTSMILFALTPVNSLVQRVLLTRKFYREANRPIVSLRWWGLTAVIMFWTTFLLPFVVVGGCFIIVLVTLSSGGGIH